MEIDGSRANFNLLTTYYGSGASERMAAAWRSKCVALRGTTLTAQFRDLRRFLKWSAIQAEMQPDSSSAAFVRAVQDGSGGRLARQVMHQAVDAFAERLRNLECREVVSTPNIITRMKVLQNAIAQVRRLSATGLWPNVGRIRPVVRGVIHGDNVPGLGELTRVERVAQLRERPTRLTRDGRWQDVLALSEQRCARLREIAEAVFLRGYEDYQKGEEILASSAAPVGVAEFVELVQADERPVSLSLAVSFLHSTSLRGKALEQAFPDDVSQRIDALGGWRRLLEYVEPSPRTLLAGQLVFLCDTGFNVAPCDLLAAEPFVGEAKRGAIRVITAAAAKLRAKGKIVEADLFEDTRVPVRAKDGQAISSYQLVRRWQVMTGRLREEATREGLPAQDLLWICRPYHTHPGRICSIPAHIALDQITEILAPHFDDPIIGGLPIRRKMLRPTVVHIEAIRADFKPDGAKVKAGHSKAATTMRYLSSPWFENVLHGKIRAFQNEFEAQLLDGGGMEPADRVSHEQRLERARATGLGFLCSAPPSAETLCLALDTCANCRLRQFKPTRQSIRDLLLFNRSLRAEADRMIAANPARWAEVWLDSLAITEAILSVLRRSHHRQETVAAERLLDLQIRAEELELVPLW